MGRFFALFILLSLFIGTENLSAQNNRKHKQRFKSKGKNWNLYRHEFEFGVGVCNYLGDLGGNTTTGKIKTPLKDVEATEYKLGYLFGYRYNFNKILALRPTLFFGKVSGSDALTSNYERNYRNLSFQTRIVELAVLGELHILRADAGHSDYHPGVFGEPGRPFGISLHAGIGFFHYQPRHGRVKLRELSTEGQGLPGGAQPYKKMALAMPLGFSMGYQFNKLIRVGIDATIRYTNTDYIDDASSAYFDKEIIRKSKGDLAAELSDRSTGVNPGITSIGSPRGNPDNNDFYFSGMLIFTYTPLIQSRGGHRGKKAKF